MKRYGHVVRFWSEKLMPKPTITPFWYGRGFGVNSKLDYLIYFYPSMTPLKKLLIKIPQRI